MKLKTAFLLFLIILSAGCGKEDAPYDTNTSVPKGDPKFPPLEYSWVIDSAQVVSSEVEKEADRICQSLKEDRIAEVVVVTMTNVNHPEEWATHYGRWLKLGAKGPSGEGGNNGIVWLIRPDMKNRLTISVGRGLPRFTSSDYGKIMNDNKDYFNFGNYDRGVLNLVKDTNSVLRKIYGSKTK